MALDTDLGPLSDLAESLGILVDGDFNPTWFENPLGEAAADGRPTAPGLTTALFDDRQRRALIAFADEALGDPDRRTVGDGATWLPLVSTAGLTVFAVIEEPAGRPLQIGIGAEYTTSADNVEVGVTVHVRAFQVERQGHGLTSTGGPAPWLLLGKPEGTIDLAVNLTNTDTPSPGEFHLGGATIGGTIPTAPSGPLSVDVRLNSLQLPGSDQPRDHHLELESLADAAGDVLEFIAGLVKAQADALDASDPVTRPFAALASLIGLRHTAGLDDLPLAEFVDRGVDPLVEWVEGTLATPAGRSAWLGELARLLGGTAEPDRGAVRFSAGPVTVRVGVKTPTGSHGSAVITPWVELALSARAGGDLVVRADLFTIDTTDGTTTAFPVIDSAAVFGARATSGSPLLDDGMEIGSVDIGLRVTAGRPAFSLLAHDVELPSGRGYEVVDLSSPEAVRDVASTVLDGELAALLDQLGDGGAVLKRVLGLDPPTGVTGVDGVDLLTGPLPAVAGYWQRLVAAPAALAEVIDDLVRLVLGPTAVSGGGRVDDPWLIPIGAASPSPSVSLSARLAVWVDGSTVAVDVVVASVAEVSGNLRAGLDGRVAVARVDPTVPSVDLVTRVSARLGISTSDGSPVELELAPGAVTADSLAVEVGWRSRADRSSGTRIPTGLAVDLLAPGLAVDLRPLGGGHHPIPLPRFGPDGSLVWEPDWANVEDLLVSLLGRTGDPTVGIVLELIGWRGDGAYLPLVELLDDPSAALRRWLADLVLDCGNVSSALVPFAELLSAFTVHRPSGYGSRRRPFRAPIAGHAGAPGVSAWLHPPCPLPEQESGRPGRFDPSVDSRGPDIVAALHDAATALADVGDLLVGRPGLPDALTQLVERLAGTDGVVGRPASLPSGVTGHDADGYGYRNLVALGAIDRLGPLILGEQPADRLYVGIEEEWATAFSVSVDRSTIEAVEAATEPGLPAGSGPWSARLPSLADARIQRPERGGLDEQARRLVDLVEGRAAPVTVIAYGQLGAAAARATTMTDRIGRVVTVGSPWSEPAVDAFTVGSAADALRLLGLLAAGGPPDLPSALLALEASPVTMLEHIIGRLAPGDGPPVASDVGDLIDVSTVTDPAGMAAGTTIDAVFGRLSADELWLAAADLVELGIDDRYEQLFEYGFEQDPLDLTDDGDSDGDTADDTADRDDDEPEELHVGFDLPAFDLDLNGLLVGVGARLETYWFDRHPDTAELRLHDEQDLILTVHIGLTDRWLVGGPTATNTDIEVRWVELRITLPLDDRPSHTSVVLHEARCFDVFRERWEIDAEQLRATTDTTTSLPEVHLILGEVVRRIEASLPTIIVDGEGLPNEISDLLSRLGITRNGGYDPAGFERFLFEPALSMQRLRTDPAGAAELIRALSAHGSGEVTVGGSGSVLELRVETGPSQLALTTDLATGSLTATLTADAVGIAPIEIGLTVDGGSLASSMAVGAISPTEGGIRLLVERSAETSVVIQWAGPTAGRPGSTAPDEIDLLAGGGPSPSDLVRLLRPLAALVPAALARAALEQLRRTVGSESRDALNGVLDGLALLDRDAVSDDLADLSPEEVTIPIRVPVGLFLDPLGWLRSGAEGWRDDPLGQAVALLDTIGPLVGVDPPSGVRSGDQRTWPITDRVALQYQLTDGRLALGVAIDAGHQLDGRTVTTAFGLGLGLTAPSSGISVAPDLAARFDIDGRGLRLLVDPSVSLALLRPSPAPPFTVYPWAGDVGSLVASGASMVIPPVLNALIARRTDASASLTRSVAQVVFDLGQALELLESGQFTEGRVVAFADDPGRALTDHVAAVGQVAVNSLVDALNDGGPSLVRRDGDRMVIGPAGSDRGHLALTFDDSGPLPAVVIDASLPVDGVGTISITELRLRPDGLQVAASYRGEFDVGGSLTLRPLLAVSAGVDEAGFTRSVTAALALDGSGERTAGLRWALDASPPTLVGTAPVGQPADPALNLGLLALSLATSVAVELADPVLGDRARPALRGVLLDPAGTGTDTTVDPGFFVDLFDPDALLTRLFRLLANLGQAGLKVDIGTNPTLTVGYHADTDGTHHHYGLTVSLGGTGRFKLVDDPLIEIDIDGSWINGTGPAGLTLVGLRQSVADPTDFSFGPRIIARGLGIRVGQQSGPLLELGGLGIDAIALHLYGESNPSGAGVGAQLRLEGLAFTPAGGGDNQVASGIMNDAAAAGGDDARPSFSPGIAVQRSPGADQDVAVSVSAGEPPGPWWLVVQRELGPLYLERFGFDSTEQNGRVVAISLLFDGRVSLFGLTAQVDQLAIRWSGNSITDGNNWHVDIQGFAITADLSGVFISGGLLKTELDGNPGYLGMLMGRFGVYGLSLFGGYTRVGDTPSFFIFGAVNGPIGGPPAFFVTGLGGGLGINRGLRVPDDIAVLNEYPFIRALDAGSVSDRPPLDQIRELGDYFPVELGNIWFAAGVSFTCFSLVDGIAVVSVSFGSGLDINLMGLARMALPRPEAALVSIELGLLARFSTEEGLFLIQAQLTDNSWLLYPDVRLTGGFAFATWWKGANAGQFVLTLGGYHPTFRRAGYPEVPRLGLVWQVSDSIVIKGGSYFALTSEALMAGIDVEASADFGFAWARIAFGAHGIVYFDPFWFRVEAYASISAGIKIKTFLGTIRISISFAASVLVEGPDVSGVATIEVGPAEFDVPFGSRRKDKRPAINWSQFVDKYLEEASPGEAAAISSVAGSGAVPAPTGDRAGAPSPDGSGDKPFQVFAEFELTVITTVPFTSLVVGHPEPRPVPAVLSDGSETTLGLAPMQATGLLSSLRLALFYEVGDDLYVPKPAESAALVDGLTAEPVPGSAASGPSGPPAGTPTYGYNGFPLGVWGRPNDAEAEDKPLPSAEVVFAGNRIRLVSKASLDDLVGPQIVYRQVRSGRRPLPLSATGPSRGELLGVAAGFADVEVADAQQALATARRVLFGGTGTAATITASVDNDGTGRSRLARAGYRGSRNAPPMFGTLAEGIDLSNPDGADTAVIDDGPATPKRTVRAPKVVGYVGAGSGRSPKTGFTTVSQSGIGRRPAPSTASVKRRLGRTLPIDLHRTSVLPSVDGATVTSRTAVPHTGTVAPWVETDRRLLDTMGTSLVSSSPVSSAGGAGAGADATPGVGLVAGEGLVLELPDADIDLDADNRPLLSGTGPIRMVAVGIDGSVLADRVNHATTGDEVWSWPIPVGTGRVVTLSAAPPDADRTMGWLDSSRVLWSGRGTAIGARCVLRFSGQGVTRRVGWLPAASPARESDAITTTFAGPPRTVAIVLSDTRSTTGTSAGTTAMLEEVGVALDGVRIAAGSRSGSRSDGEVGTDPGRGDAATVRPAVMVQSGPYSVIIVGVEPDPDRKDQPVRVTTDLGRRRVVGVLGSNLPPQALADTVVASGVHALVPDPTARARSATTAPTTLAWHPAQPSVDPEDDDQ